MIELEALNRDTDERPVNLVRSVRSLLDDETWIISRDVFDIRVHAPQWTDDDIKRFVEEPNAAGHLSEDPFRLDAYQVASLRSEMSPFLRTTSREPKSDADRWDIVYSTPSRLLVTLGSPRSIPVMAAALVGAKTRLLIVHSKLSGGRDPIFEFIARQLVDAGVPAVVLVRASKPKAVDLYLHEMLRRIMHDSMLDEIVNIDVPGTDVLCVANNDASGIFGLGPYVEHLSNSIESLARDANASSTELRQNGQLLHRKQYTDLADRLDEAARTLAHQAQNVRMIGSYEWLREADGVKPLARIVHEIRNIGPIVKAPDVIEQAPRVLNAAVRGDEGDLDAYDGMRPATRYWLDVQIGPRWTHRASIVQGAADFPEKALDDSREIHVLDVALVSDDLEPKEVFGTLRLPRAGPSFPGAGDQSVMNGALALPFMTPFEDDPSRCRRIDARLCIYYENTLLQSARFVANVVAQGEKVYQPSSIIVDYAVTGSYARLNRFARRKLYPQRADSPFLPVALSILQNGNQGQHRIVVKGSTLKPAWRRYDPGGNADALKLTRDDLLTCLNQQSKSFATFKKDLKRLVLRGAKLYHIAFSQFPGMTDLISYLRNLDNTLRSKAVIEVAFSGLTQYVFPWALIYDIQVDISDDKLEVYCPIIGTGSLPWADGPRDHCPNRDEPWHKKNVMCPYGFWGLRHIIEQPLSAIPEDSADTLECEPRNPMLTESSAVIALGVARRGMPKHIVDGHVRAISELGSVAPIGGGDSWNSVSGKLSEAAIVYFLCHGMYDDEKEPYLEIGRDDRIYARYLTIWAMDQALPEGQRALSRFPLVLINGCHTTALTGEQLVNFVQNFASLGASGVVGTEVAIPVDFAAEFALAFLKKIPGMGLGEAVYQTRWEFARRGNLMGLVYTPYGLADVGFGAPNTTPTPPRVRHESMTQAGAPA
ncbi:MAG: CHAT domain-containing protein [Candidatus Eremiobacteraeota bacterium]|nr:CHAT domain-containing protein [Candidatus Eremiobacteraeota bacterium]